MTAAVAGVPVVEGWFTTGPAPALLGTRCDECATVFFPPATGLCRNPGCRGRNLEVVELSRSGTVWSCTDARYQPPPPFIAAEPYEPFAIAAVQLVAEQLVVLGQVAAGYGVEDLSVGTEVELVIETLHEIDGVPQLVWRWKPLDDGGPH
ncbi:MAG TPA: zinc ribbon domain-containing protein [Acidimicrobiales bacterium]|nr:zinc ribbon domain-containing protein [Acidimicrobiales bacterium]